MIDIIELKDGRKKEGHMIRVSRDVAIRIIESLSRQITNNDSNSGRTEFNGKQGYFSIAVEPEPQRLTEKEWAWNEIKAVMDTEIEKARESGDWSSIHDSMKNLAWVEPAVH